MPSEFLNLIDGTASIKNAIMSSICLSVLIDLNVLRVMIRLIGTIFLLLASGWCYAQLPDGTVAPDFTLTDYDGEEHHLYGYLDADKTVILKVFAAHCPACWNYHQTDRLKNLYNDYGPGGTDEIMVLALEHDQWNNHNAFIGDGPPWVTQGNWLEGTPFPIFDVENPDRGVFDDYEISGYPIIFKICPDRLTERIYTRETEEEIYEKITGCPGILSNQNNEDVDDFLKVFSDGNGNLRIWMKEPGRFSLRIFNSGGQIVHSSFVSNRHTSLSGFSKGLYLLEVSSESARWVKKVVIP